MRTGPLADTGGRSCTAILYCTPGFDNRYYLRLSGLALLRKIERAETIRRVPPPARGPIDALLVARRQ
jgi:hypothetical protein